MKKSALISEQLGKTFYDYRKNRPIFDRKNVTKANPVLFSVIKRFFAPALIISSCVLKTEWGEGKNYSPFDKKFLHP